MAGVGVGVDPVPRLVPGPERQRLWWLWNWNSMELELWMHAPTNHSRHVVPVLVVVAVVASLVVSGLWRL